VSLAVGKNPRSDAAAALYIAGVQTGERRTQAQMAGAARTTPVTIRNRFKELLDVLQIDLEIKRGAAAVPVYIEDRVAFARSVLN
jgi:transcription initiation factor TFIIB